MGQANRDSYYTGPGEALEQGDIFRVDLVGPAADEVQRIFRTRDGRHGSVVFEENCDATVFTRGELEALLETASRTPLHTDPFHRTQDGQEEMVVVFSRLFRYFMIATQTCDICGIDKAAVEWATILPVIPLADFCKNELLPFTSIDKPITIHEFVRKQCEEDGRLDTAGDIEYARVLRDIVQSLVGSVLNKRVKQDVGYVRNYLRDYYKKIYMFLLPADPKFQLPESYVDFTSAFTVPTSKLLAIRTVRFAKINDPYRIDFAQKFGAFFARVALPKPMRPE